MERGENGYLKAPLHLERGWGEVKRQ